MHIGVFQRSFCASALSCDRVELEAVRSLQKLKWFSTIQTSAFPILMHYVQSPLRHGSSNQVSCPNTELRLFAGERNGEPTEDSIPCFLNAGVVSKYRDVIYMLWISIPSQTDTYTSFHQLPKNARVPSNLLSFLSLFDLLIETAWNRQFCY